MTAESARTLVERMLAQLGYSVGTPGGEGRQKTPREIEDDVRAFLNQPAFGEAPRRHSTRRSSRPRLRRG